MIWEVLLLTLVTCAMIVYILNRADLRMYLEQLKRELRGD